MELTRAGRRWRRSAPFVLLAVAFGAVDLTPVGSTPSASAASWSARPDVFHVDPQVKPTVGPIADPVDGFPRPVGAIADEDGRLDQFTANEILLETDDASRVRAFLARFGGRVIETIPVEGDEALDSQGQHAIRMDPARLLDTTLLAADLEALDPGYGGEVMRASDQQTLQLLATAARAQVEGFEVELDLVVLPPEGHRAVGGVPSVEVTDAWRLLDRVGRLRPVVDVGILASGSGPAQDGSLAAAGVGGPVIDRLVTVDLDGRGTVRAVNSALRELDRGPANVVDLAIRLEHRVRFRPIAVKWTARVIRRMDDRNMLLFAATGDRRPEVDRPACGPSGRPCRRRWHILPCELDRVRCVDGPGAVGVAALVWTARPSLTNNEVFAVSAPNGEVVDAGGAVRAAQRT